MFGTFGQIVAAMAGLVPASALAMSTVEHHHCRVVAGEKLPSAVGGPEAICTAIKQAAAKRAPNAHFSAEVKVLAKGTLATTLIVNGQLLPEEKFAVTDRELNPRSIERFANSIATKIAAAAEQ